MARSIFRLGGIWGLLRRLNRGEAVLSERALSLSPAAWRCIVSWVRCASASPPSANPASRSRSTPRAPSSRPDAVRRWRRSARRRALAASGAQIAGLSASTSTHAREIAEVSGQNLQAAERALAELSEVRNGSTA